MPKGWVFLLLVNGKSTCRPSKYDKLFGDENEPPFQTDITNCLTKMFRVFPHFSSFGLIYARSCQNISLEYDWNYKNRSLGSYLGCCQDIFKIRNSPNPKFPKSRLGKLIYLVPRPGLLRTSTSMPSRIFKALVSVLRFVAEVLIFVHGLHDWLANFRDTMLQQHVVNVGLSRR